MVNRPAHKLKVIGFLLIVIGLMLSIRGVNYDQLDPILIIPGIIILVIGVVAFTNGHRDSRKLTKIILLPYRKIIINVLIWSFAGLFMVFATAAVFGDIEIFGGMFVVSVGILFCLCGAVIQSIFIANNYYQLKAAKAILAIWALINFIALAISLQFLYLAFWGVYSLDILTEFYLSNFWGITKIVIFPSYVVSAVVYRFTVDNSRTSSNGS